MIAILTTKTLHHAHFVNSIFKRKRNMYCIIEKKKINPNFKTKVNFENIRDHYERDRWFKNSRPKFLSNTYVVENINSKKTRNIIKKKKTKYILIFGTRKFHLKYYEKLKGKIYNFHGGNPEKYRGLDSHYWAIYHKDFKSLEVCLHQASSRLDTGKILFRERIKYNQKTKIYELRALNTEICIKMALKFIKMVEKKNKFKLKKQKKLGRYYSFMPAVLKNKIHKKMKFYE